MRMGSDVLLTFYFDLLCSILSADLAFSLGPVSLRLLVLEVEDEARIYTRAASVPFTTSSVVSLIFLVKNPLEYGSDVSNLEAAMVSELFLYTISFQHGSLSPSLLFSFGFIHFNSLFPGSSSLPALALC
jgi:hypothetical protein